MTKILSILLNRFSRGEIEKTEVFALFQLETGQILAENLFIAKLEKAKLDGNSEDIDLYIRLAFILGLSSKSTRILCELLLEDFHYMHEDIARLLQSLKDPNSVNCLYKAISFEPKHLSYDDSSEFARKCIKALAAIPDSLAISKLREITASENRQIAAYAKKELNYLT